MQISKREEDLMNLFWGIEGPLTADDLEKKLKDSDWNHAAIFRTLKSLNEKQLIKVVGVERHCKQYARQFVPTMTQEEFYTHYLLERKMSAKVLQGISAALLGAGSKTDNKEVIIERLEQIIQELKEEGEHKN